MPHVPRTKVRGGSSSGGVAAWVVGTPYSVGDFVYNLDTVYVATEDHTSSATFLLDQAKWLAMASTYTHEQSSPDTTWTIDHDLGRKPIVQTLDTSYKIIEGEVEHNTNNRTYVYFNTAVAGYAICG